MKNNFCSVCATTGDTELHHIVPLSLGGPNTLSNLVELCLSCHSKAHNHRAAWREKARQGIERAKKAGVYKGRPKSINRERVFYLKEQGIRVTDIARDMCIGRASVYRILAEEDND